jgi:ATP-binding cassette, subfamily A (ABC1), member 3
MGSYGMPIKYAKLKGKRLYMQQFAALILKRMLHYRRNLRVILTNILLPCFFVALSMGFANIRPKPTTQVSLAMSPSIYIPNKIFMT